MRFENKVALITGAADGIGKATAQILAREGAQVVAVDINDRTLATLAEEIEAAGGKIITIEADVLDSEQVQRMVETAVVKCGRVDILVNAVGGSTVIPNSGAPVDELTPEEWDKII